MEVLKASETYPCQDFPTTCGWTKQPKYICVYPDCWCKHWLVGRPMNNKNMDKGQQFKAILYRGKEKELAEAIFKQFRSAKDENKTVPTTESRCSIRLSGVELVQMCGIYQVDITGEIE